MRARIKLPVRSIGAIVAPVFAILALAVLGPVVARAQGVPTFRAPTTAPTTEPVPVPNAPSATGPPRTIAPRFNPPTSSASTLNSPAPGAPALGVASFRMEELDQLVAPVALYPDTLLVQVLIASTYPLEVAVAAQWLQQNPNLQGEQLTSALNAQNWDASVKALTQVPTVLQQMSGQLEWTRKLGDAFLAQQKDVMDSVQRLRQRAQDAGQLMTTAQQRVVTEGEAIVIEQPYPEILYVPYYDPYTVYGGWPYPAYPPYYWSAYGPDYWWGWPGYGLGWGIGWGLGIGITAAVWDCAFDWGHGDINVNVDRNNFTNIDRNRIDNVERDARGNRVDNANRDNRGNRLNDGNTQRWQHNAEHRRTDYRDQATRERFGNRNAGQANARRDFRGFDQAQVRDQLAQRGDRQRTSLDRRGQPGNFQGAGNGPQTRGSAERGLSSRQTTAPYGNRGGTSRGSFAGGAGRDGLGSGGRGVTGSGRGFTGGGPSFAAGGRSFAGGGRGVSGGGGGSRSFAGGGGGRSSAGGGGSRGFAGGGGGRSLAGGGVGGGGRGGGGGRR